MANSSKRAWKLQEFVAHSANVNTLALGHKSGRVLVTGGDDKKVNLWAVGKPNCIMSLLGHSSPVTSVTFGPSENTVVGGSLSGSLKLWDLESVTLLSSYNGGHSSRISSIDFHPNAQTLASASNDGFLKLWDLRSKNNGTRGTGGSRSGPILSLGHNGSKVSRLTFSPDGLWIASGGSDGVVKLWDLRAGKLMKEFPHSSPSSTSTSSTSTSSSSTINDVEFHPHEFLLASASNSLHFWDLETFSSLSNSSCSSPSKIRKILFHSEANVVFSASSTGLRVNSWEPSILMDSIPISWGNVMDIAITSCQLVGASLCNLNVSLYIVDLKRVKPFGNPGVHCNKQQQRDNSSIQQHQQHQQVDKNSSSFISSPPSCLYLEKSQLQQERIFLPRERNLSRTPPLRTHRASEPRTFAYPENLRQNPLKDQHLHESQPTGKTIISLGAFRETRSCSLEPSTTGEHNLEGQTYFSASSCSSSSSSSFSSSSKPLDRPTAVQPFPMNSEIPLGLSVEDFRDNRLFRPPLTSSSSYLSCTSVSLSPTSTSKDLSESQVSSFIFGGHGSLMALLSERGRKLESIQKMWMTKDAKTAVEYAISTKDEAVVVDLLSVITLRPSIWNLDLCTALLPSISSFLTSKYEMYIQSGCVALKLILKNFASVIKSNIDSPVTLGVDISREERQHKCMECYSQLVKIRSVLLKGSTTLEGQLRHSFRELSILMAYLD